METRVPIETGRALLAKEGVSQWPAFRQIRWFARKEPAASVCAVILVAAAVVAIVGPYIVPHDPFNPDFALQLQSPSLTHPAGTDNLGRDIFSRLIHASRYTLGIGFIATILSLGVAALVGLVSAYTGKFVDLIIQRFVDGVMIIPRLLLLIFIVSVLGPGIETVIVVLGISSGISGSRVVRGAALEVMSKDYIDAARVIGVPWWRMIFRHVLPNIAAPLIVLASIGLGSAILAESSLSFLGFGVPPPEPTWGQMLGLSARPYFVRAPWMAIAPGVALSIVVFAINLFGDGLRDRLDPRMRGR